MHQLQKPWFKAAEVEVNRLNPCEKEILSVMFMLETAKQISANKRLW
jgi:hypothetical protein